MPVKVYGNFGDFAAFGFDWGGALKKGLEIAQSVIPGHTVVGKIIGSPTSPSSPTSTPAVIVPQPPVSTMPSWVLPVAIGGGALLLIMLLRPRGRRR